MVLFDILLSIILKFLRTRWYLLGFFDYKSMLFSLFSELLVSPMELWVWLLVWLVCILQKLSRGYWRNFRVLHLEYVFQISPDEYRIFSLHLPSICCCWWGPVVSYSFECFLSYFCRDSGLSWPWQYCDWKILLQERNTPHSSEYYQSSSCLWVYNLFVL